MANQLYNKARERFLTGQINWSTADVRALLVDVGGGGSQYAFNTTHEFLSSVPVAARIAGPVALAGKTATDGAADANDTTFTSVSGVTCEAVILYIHTGVDATSVLLAYIDVATGLPITPNGGDIILSWDNGANRIFRL